MPLALVQSPRQKYKEGGLEQARRFIIAAGYSKIRKEMVNYFKSPVGKKNIAFNQKSLPLPHED